MTPTVQLPIGGAAAEAEDDAESSPRAGKSILVVDDEAAIRELLALVLREAGLRVELAASAKAALDRLAEGKFDLLILDIRMPEMDGMELYKEVVQRYPEMAKRVVFTTGDIVSGDIRLFLERTGREVLGKPFDLQELLRVVWRALEEAGG